MNSKYTPAHSLPTFLPSLDVFPEQFFCLPTLTSIFLVSPAAGGGGGGVDMCLRRPQRGRRAQVVVVVERPALDGRLRPVRVVVESLGPAASGWFV